MLRVCDFCHDTLTSNKDKKELQKKADVKDPPLLILYNKLLDCMTQIQDLKDKYNRNFRKLHKRKDLHLYEETVTMRNTVMKLFDVIDICGKKIVVQAKPKKEGQVRCSQKIANNIRKRSLEFTQLNKVAFMKLPTAQEVNQWRRQMLERERAQAIRQQQQQEQQQKQQQHQQQRQQQNPEQQHQQQAQHRQHQQRQQQQRQEQEQQERVAQNRGYSRKLPNETTKPKAEVEDTTFLKEETRVNLRRQLRIAQKEGNIDAVRALQEQMEHLEAF